MFGLFMSRKEIILETMLRIIAKQGIHATPMSQIARESGVATGTIYHHFKSKEDILNALYLNLKEDFGRLLANTMNEKLSYKEQYFFTCKALFNYYVDNPLKFVFAENVAKSPLISEEVKKKGKIFYQPVLDFLKDGINRGILGKANIDLISSIVFGNIISIVQLHVTKELEITESILQDAIAISWRGLIKH